MDTRRAIELLRRLQDEIPALPATNKSAEFASWDERTRSVLARSLGASHHITERFGSLSWIDRVVGGDSMDRRAFIDAAVKAKGLIDAAIFELEELSAPDAGGSDAAYDPELWEHVQPHVLAEEWGKVASQTAIFTEDRIRKWAGRPVTEIGEALMTAVLGDKGDYRLGRTSGEQQGWHRLGMGISMALRNVDVHRIQERPDNKRYAMGVLGVSSLLLTQLRYEHGNRFKDTGPAAVDALAEA